MEDGLIGFGHPLFAGNDDSQEPVEELELAPRLCERLGRPVRKRVQRKAGSADVRECGDVVADRAGEHLWPAFVVRADQLLMLGMASNELLGRLSQRAPAILEHVPFVRRNVGQKPLHLLLVVEQPTVQMARIPVDEDPAQVENDEPVAVAPHELCERMRSYFTNASRARVTSHTASGATSAVTTPPMVVRCHGHVDTLRYSSRAMPSACRASLRLPVSSTWPSSSLVRSCAMVDWMRWPSSSMLRAFCCSISRWADHNGAKKAAAASSVGTPAPKSHVIEVPNCARAIVARITAAIVKMTIAAARRANAVSGRTRSTSKFMRWL